MGEQRDNVLVRANDGTLQAVFNPPNGMSSNDFLLMQAGYFHACIGEEIAESDDTLHYYLRHLESMKLLVTNLELPWCEFIPIAHRGSLVSITPIQGEKAGKELPKYSNALITCLSFLTKQNNLIHKMAVYYDQQIRDLKLLIENRKKAVILNNEEAKD